MHNNSEIDQKTQHFKNILLQMKQEDKEKLLDVMMQMLSEQNKGAKTQ